MFKHDKNKIVKKKRQDYPLEIFFLFNNIQYKWNIRMLKPDKLTLLKLIVKRICIIFPLEINK